jgi:hypothetical protein
MRFIMAVHFVNGALGLRIAPEWHLKTTFSKPHAIKIVQMNLQLQPLFVP